MVRVAQENVSSLVNFPSLSKSLYTLKGDPYPLMKYYNGNLGWDIQKQGRLNAEMQLQEQQADRPLFKGMLHIEINFYFKPPPPGSKKYKREFLQGSPCGLKPALREFVGFIETIGVNVLWAPDSIITSLISKKLYDLNPRTEIFIVELK